MATKSTTRHHVVEAGEHTEKRVKAFAEKWGYSEADARRYLCQYALNRLDTLQRNADKNPKPKKERKPKAVKAAAKPKMTPEERKAKAKAVRAKIKAEKAAKVAA